MKPKRPAPRPIKWYKREFLNPKSGTAFVESTFSYSSESEWTSGSFKVADCNSSIVLDFDCTLGTDRHSKNASVTARLSKIDMLINHLMGMREALSEAADRRAEDKALWAQYHKELDAYEKAKGVKPNVLSSVLEDEA